MSRVIICYRFAEVSCTLLSHTISHFSSCDNLVLLSCDTAAAHSNHVTTHSPSILTVFHEGGV